MPKASHAFRTERKVVRFTPDEFATITARAHDSRITPTDYIRTKALDQSTTSRTTRALAVDQKLMLSALGLLADRGSDLQDILHQLEVGEQPLRPMLEFALSRNVEASETILRAMDVDL